MERYDPYAGNVQAHFLTFDWTLSARMGVRVYGLID